MAYRTKTDIAQQMLRDQIRSGEFIPGQRLLVEELADHLTMSPTPVREALRILQADGLVSYRPHQGAIVLGLTREEVNEVYLIRSLLEPCAVELSVDRMTEGTLAGVEALHAAYCEVAASEHGPEEHAAATEAWHWALYNGAESPRLLDTLRRLWDVFPWRVTWGVAGRQEATIAEHEEVMVAIRAREGSRASELMRLHILSGRETILAMLPRD